jgi:hypothetical protein
MYNVARARISSTYSARDADVRGPSFRRRQIELGRASYFTCSATWKNNVRLQAPQIVGALIYNRNVSIDLVCIACSARRADLAHCEST